MTQAEQMLAAARRLAGLGLAVHWLRGPKSGGKAPLAKEWQRAPYSAPAQVDEGWRSGCNLGVHTGLVAGAPRSVVVVDLDSPAALAWAQEHLPATPWRTLTRKGEHWYYLHPGKPAHIARELGQTLQGLADLVRDGRQMMINRRV